MTDREKLLEILRQVSGYCLPCVTGELHLELLATALSANGVTVQKWIPVTGRLPEHKQLVFVTDTDGSVFSTLFYSEEYFCRNYTHWMPTPEPPKE